MRRGFTIVELLIVIVVIGILAAITVVAYNGVVQGARNAARVSSVRAILDSAAIYEATHGAGALDAALAPSSGDSAHCIGTDFQNVGEAGNPTCRYVVYVNGSTVSIPSSATLYQALQSAATFSMRYEPVTQIAPSGTVARVESSSPYLSMYRPTSVGDTTTFTLDGGTPKNRATLLSYRLEGVEQDCKLPVVRQVASRQYTSGHKYSVSLGGATECWVWLDW